MFDSDVWVLGTPVYWWGPTGQFKTFLDRWYGVNDRKLFEGKEVILIIPLGGTSERGYGPTLNILTRAVRYLKMNLVTTILATGVGKKGAIKNHPELLASARKAGNSIALIDSY